MEGGESHTYRADSYPRYSYFQQRLKGLLPRWQKILETAGIPNCFSQGVHKLKLIIAAAESVGDKVTINVFADDVVLKSGDLKLTTHRRWDVEKKSISWNNYVSTADKSSDLEQTVTVIVDTDRDGRLVEELKNLPTSQQENIIIFHADTKTSYQFRELQDKQFDASKLEQITDEKILERNRDLVKQIQYLLERKVILVFEMIAEYIQVFLPKLEEELDQSLLDFVKVKLIRSLGDPFVVKDLSPYEKQDGTEKQDIDEVFHRNLTDFVCKKTKCVVCETLAKKYGIPAWLINEFLNVGFFDYESKLLKDLLKSMELPKWPKDEQESGVAVCKKFSFRCADSMTKLIHETEDYIKLKLKILTVLKKLHFELCGYLLQSDVQTDTEIPGIPELPLQLQYALLDVPEILGCGTCFGELLLHVKQTLFPAKRAEVRQILQDYKYMGGFTTQLMEERKENAQGLLLEQGQELRATKIDPGQNYPHSFGSLGCFVRIRPKRDIRNDDRSAAGAMPSTAYIIESDKNHCLTCAHCVRDCHEDIEVQDRIQYTTIGKKKCYLYEPEALDVATIQVLDNKLNNCDSKLKRSNRIPVDNWRVSQFDPLRRDVHKEGCASRFTKGIVMSTNYMTTKIRDYNARYFSEGSNKRFSLAYNILVESLPGYGEVIEPVLSGQGGEPFQVHPFSMEGDSGSVICVDDPNDLNLVHVVALLLGAVTRSQGFLHSYGSLMNRLLAEVEEQFHCIIEPSVLPPRGTVAELPEGAASRFSSLP